MCKGAPLTSSPPEGSGKEHHSPDKGICISEQLLEHTGSWGVARISIKSGACLVMAPGEHMKSNVEETGSSRGCFETSWQV